MIFPILSGLVHPFRTPMTLVLFVLNVLVFLATSVESERQDARMDDILTDPVFLQVQGQTFSLMIESQPAEFSGALRELARKGLAGHVESRKILGTLALRNSVFMSRAEEFDFKGDEIAIAKWREKFIQLKQIQLEHPAFMMGISRVKSDWVQFITYQFSHSGLLHLFWNMTFLLLFGAFVEISLGSSFVVLTYVGAGLLGAQSFAYLSGISSSPLVGASAGVSGLMALVGVYWLRKEKLRFFYWLLPIDGYFGFVHLPSWLILLVSLLPDLSGYIGASKEFGSVAYSAHLGGTAFGVLMAACLFIGLLKTEVETHDDRDGHDDNDRNADQDIKRAS